MRQNITKLASIALVGGLIGRGLRYTLNIIISRGLGAEALGLFAFGILTSSQIKDKYVWVVALIAPIVSYAINLYSPVLLNGYQIGFEILIINGLLMFLGLVLIRRK